MLSKGNLNNPKVIEAQLTRTGNGLWIYEESGVEWSAFDTIEYWLSTEAADLGYYTNKIVRVQGNQNISRHIHSFEAI